MALVFDDETCDRLLRELYDRYRCSPLYEAMFQLDPEPAVVGSESDGDTQEAADTPKSEDDPAPRERGR